MSAGVRTILEREPDIEVVGEVDDGRRAVAMAQARRPTVVVADIDLPGIDGIQATRQIAGPGAQHPAGVIIVTNRDDDEHVARAISAGARGFLLKGDPPGQVVYGIKAIAAGKALLTPAVTGRLLEQFAGHLAARQLTPPNPFTELTSRETEVLRLLALGGSNAQVATELVVTEATVRSHTHHLLQKLRLHDRSQAVALAYQHGLVRPRQS